MNKEQQELLSEVFKNYLKNLMMDNVSKDDPNYILLAKEEFIGKIITNPDFAKQWGVTIYTVVEDGNTRIGVNYNNKTIESYE